METKITQIRTKKIRKTKISIKSKNYIDYGWKIKKHKDSNTKYKVSSLK